MTFWKSNRIVVTGGGGFLGQAVCRKLALRGCAHIYVPRRAEFDLTLEADAKKMYDQFKPDIVIHLAAEIGGIGANREHPGRFFFANMAMGLHLIEQARQRGIRKFVQVGTACSYPRDIESPFKEDHLWEGYPEKTNAPYGIAKRTLLVMLEAYKREYALNSVAVIPVNLYGPGDNFDLETSHVIPALIRKCCEAIDAGKPSINCWGTGSASREFLYVEDAAEGILCAAEQMEEPSPINLGTGHEIKVSDLVQLIAKLCGFEGEIIWDSSKPDGQPHRRMDVSRAQSMLGWQAKVSLEEGLRKTIEWFRKQDSIREVRYA